jgi:hypothetical protein
MPGAVFGTLARAGASPISVSSAGASAAIVPPPDSPDRGLPKRRSDPPAARRLSRGAAQGRMCSAGTGPKKRRERFMIDEQRLQATIDRSEIQDVVSRSIVSRDSGLWEKLAACYHSKAEFTSSWWKGPASEFIKAARPRLEASREEGGEQKHMTSNHVIDVKGERATAECDLILFSRAPINGVDIDWMTFSRRLHLMARENGEWKIWRRFAIYERARMDAIDPTADPADFFFSKDMEKYPKSMRIHMWRLEVKGSGPVKELCIRGTEREKKVRGEAQEWMAGA